MAVLSTVILQGCSIAGNEITGGERIETVFVDIQSISFQGSGGLLRGFRFPITRVGGGG